MITAAARRYVQARQRTGGPATDKVYFLMVTVDGIGGVARAVLAHAAALADGHDVEIVSLYRRRDKPMFPVDPRVRITYLEDQRRRKGVGAQGNAWRRARNAPGRSLLRAGLDRRPTALSAWDDADLSLLTDVLVARHIPKLEPGVLITARPALHAVVAALAPTHLLTVAHEHVHFGRRMRKPQMKQILAAVTERCDAMITLTRADAADYRRAFPDAHALIASVPNPSPWEPIETAPDLDQKVIVSAGRLNPQKGFDRLIAAYAPIVKQHPDWQLHIYGKGEEGDALRKLIADLGVEDAVSLKGFAEHMPTALSAGSIFALASRFEPFGMVLVEAMSRGLPVVSYDAPRGPREIIDDGRTGRLVPNGDTQALTEALLQLIEDADLRRRMGREALATVTKFDPAVIAQRWDEIFGRALHRRRVP